MPIETYTGKIIPAEVIHSIKTRSSLKPEQTGTPNVLLVSQLSEYGTAYSPQELKALAAAAHSNDMKFVIDGARLFHAAAKLDVSLKEITADVAEVYLQAGLGHA